MQKQKINIRIRSMRKDDTAAVARMARKVAEFHGEKSAADAQMFIDNCMGKNKSEEVLVAFNEASPVGFIMWHNLVDFVSGEKKRIVDLLYVEEKMRSRGVGYILFSTLAKNALKNGCSSISVRAKKTNKTSNRFYKSIGLYERANDVVSYRINGAELKKMAKTI